MTLELSVVIPTFNRVEILPSVLEMLGRQSLQNERFEVIVVDDGSSDGTPRFLQSFSAPYRFRAFSQPNAGPAGARNRGVIAAQSPLVVFLGDDTVPEEAFLETHLRAHEEARGAGVAVLGYTTWPRERRVTPFLHHINEYGLQFGYELIEDPENVPFNFFYTSNISLSRGVLLEAGLFDTSFPHAAWEDIELSYRLSRCGHRIVYRPGAVVRHHHDITFSSFRRRQFRAGEAAAIFYRKHPDLADFLGVGEARAANGRPETARALWAAVCARWEIPGGRRAIDRVLRRDYLRGLCLALAADAPRGRSDPPGGQSRPEGPPAL
jgi:GT2 family glycosyltransferase